MQTRRMRLLREKHGVSIYELSRCGGISHQRLSQIELGTGNVTVHMNRLVETAFARLIAARRREVAALEKDLRIYRKHLLDFVEELEDDL